MRIDVHNHVIPERALALLRSQPAYGVTVDDGVWRGEYHAEFPLSPSFVDPDAKLAQLGHNAIDAAVLSAAPPLFFYDRDATDGAAMCAAVNDGLAEFRESAPDRLWWLAHVPCKTPSARPKCSRSRRRSRGAWERTSAARSVERGWTRTGSSLSGQPRSSWGRR
jgi:aminocarboxymuconate-semialdehyde decarboxylase